MAKTKNITLILFLAFAFLAKGQDFKLFSDNDYPLDQFEINKKSFNFSKFEVQLIQLSSKGKLDGNSIFCRSWLSLLDEGSLKSQIHYENIEAVGGCAGIYVPDQQPIPGYLIGSKFGDYNGQLIVVNHLGEIKTYLGGIFYVSKDRKYLFSNYDSDLNGLTVIDMENNEVLFESEIEKYLADWYYFDSKYYAVISEDYVQNSNIEILEFHVRSRKIEYRKVDLNSIDERNMLPRYNLILSAKDCNCKWV